MRNIYAIVLSLSLLFAGVQSFSDQSESQVLAQKNDQVQGGDYWPWGKEVNFPWKNIQGVWVSTNKYGQKRYFSFKVLSNSSDKILKVQEFDNDSCQILGRGIGYEQSKVVKARFTGVYGDFDLRIHVFRECDIGYPDDYKRKFDRFAPAVSTKVVPVMAISPAGSPGLSTVTPIYRVNSNPEIVCE